MKRKGLLLAVALCSACYTYAPAPADLSTVPNGKLVRARISSDQAQRIEPLIGRQTTVLAGVLLGSSADSVLIEVPTTATTVMGGGVQVLNQRVSFPRAGITEMQVKTLSRSRTWLVALVGTAVLGYIAIDALDIGPGKERSPTQPGGQDFHIPLLRLRR